jgi:hypothetical protein
MPTPEDVRAIVATLPGATEQETWGHPTFRVRSKMFAGMAADGTTVSVKAVKEEQEALTQTAPDTFFVPKYVGVHGWVGVTLARVDGAELEELLTEAWRMTAAKRVVAEFDAEHPAG